MTQNPTSFRLPYALPEEVHPAVRNVLRLHAQGLKDLNDAIAALAAKGTTATTVPTTVKRTTAGTSNAAVQAIPGNVVGATTSPAATGGAEPIVFSRGGTILTPAIAMNIIVWSAPFDCTITRVLGYVSGATGSTVNVQKNGSFTILVTDLALATPDAWMDGGTVQNAGIHYGDKLEIMLVSLVGAPLEVAVEIQCTRP